MTDLKQQIESAVAFDKERWLPIDGFSRYLISDHGRVMSRGRRNGPYVLLEPMKTKVGYPYVWLYRENFRKRFRIHQLVVNAFVGAQPSPNHFVGHTDDVKTNNHYSNLGWVTHKENMISAQKNNRNPKGATHGCAKLSEDDVRYIRKNYCFQTTKRSNVKDLAKKFSVCTSVIQKAASGKTFKDVK